MQILEGLLKLPENRECADCKAKYVSGWIQKRWCAYHDSEQPIIEDENWLKF